jgi:hypothetical protein
MVKSFLIIGLLLFLVSCGKSTQSEDARIVMEPMIATLEGEVPSEALSFLTNLSFTNFSLTQEEKVRRAGALIRKVIASREFKDAVINYKFNGQKTFANNNGLSNLQIYNKILWGSEVLFPTLNMAMDVELEVYFENSTTIGFTYPDTTRIWMNKKYLDGFTPVEVADNLFHEWVHKLGFTHDVAATPTRPYSVPYALGYIVKRLAYTIDLNSL